MDEKLKVRIFDSAFMPYVKSASLREENADVSPTYFEWVNAWRAEDRIFITDGHLHQGDDFPSKAVAWLIEPRSLRPENYERAKEIAHKFEWVLTYDQELLDAIPNGRFYPLGGSSISFDRWGIYPKTKDICMFVSDKKTTEGHKLRHQIAEEFGDRIDLYGAGAGNPVESKFEVLKDYRYCVVVESGFHEFYFSEKLIDPLSVGTIPVYWGCNDVYFKYGLFELPFTEILEFGEAINNNLFSKLNYRVWLQGRTYHFGEVAKKYRIAEDWLFENYQDLFT